MNTSSQRKVKAINKAKQQIAEQKSRTETMSDFLKEIEKATEPLSPFDEDIWRAVIDKVTVFHDGRMVFQFLDVSEVQA